MYIQRRNSNLRRILKETNFHVKNERSTVKQLELILNRNTLTTAKKQHQK